MKKIPFAVTEWMLERDPQEELAKAFKLFDDDDTGRISVRFCDCSKFKARIYVSLYAALSCR